MIGSAQYPWKSDDAPIELRVIGADLAENVRWNVGTVIPDRPRSHGDIFNKLARSLPVSLLPSVGVASYLGRKGHQESSPPLWGALTSPSGTISDRPGDEGEQSNNKEVRSGPHNGHRWEMRITIRSQLTGKGLKGPVRLTRGGWSSHFAFM